MEVETSEDIDHMIEEMEAEHKAKVEELRAMKASLLARNTSYSFDFTTFSSPPTFLIVVDPVSRGQQAGEQPPAAPNSPEGAVDLDAAPWTIDITRLEPPSAASASPLSFKREHSGMGVMSFEDLSPEAQQHQSTHGLVRWRSTINNRAFSTRKTRLVTFVQDSAIPHLTQVHSSTACSFVRAWKAFNKQHQGRSHQALRWCRSLLGVSLPLAALATYAVHTHANGRVRSSKEEAEKQQWSSSKEMAQAEDLGAIEKAEPMEPATDCCEGYGFHCGVVIKLLVVDLPQQVCIVLYFLGWYEQDGLRCQLCLFSPGHCEEEHPFRPANFAAIACVLLSSVANQLLVRPAWKRRISDEDVCCSQLVRVAAASVATLPVTTGIFWATSSLLIAPTLMKAFVALPCFIGWISVALLMLAWVCACCQD
jgi:hypothetical protein